MITWWSSLSGLAQGFFVAAIFFSTLFIWQFIGSLSGLGDNADANGDGAGGDMQADAQVDVQHVEFGADHTGDTPHDQFAQHDTAGLHTFRLLSIRSILAFGTLFSWAGALYLGQDHNTGLAILRALLWGMAGLLIVALFFWVLPRLTEEGTAMLDAAVGQIGHVYLDIPEDGVGQVRVLVGNTIKFVKARSRSGQRLPAGTSVRAVKMLDSVTLEVEEVES